MMMMSTRQLLMQQKRHIQRAVCSRVLVTRSPVECAVLGDGANALQTRTYVGRYYDLHPNSDVPKHRSDAEWRVNEVPPIKVPRKWAVCDGGGGATGHPAEWIQLDNRDGAVPATCKYCGLRFVMDKSKQDEKLKEKLVDRTFP